MKSYKLFFIFLGTLVSFGPFITDMYLVALPDMMKYFDVDMPTIQLTLTFAMLGLGCGQIVFGYIGDKYGRKYPLIGALVLFTISTFFSICFKNINLFLFIRFIQGCSGAGCIVLARSIIPDLFKKETLVEAISITTLIYTVNRIVSPLLGGFAFQLGGWKFIFMCLLILGIALSLSACFMPETNIKRTASKSSLKTLIRNKSFLYFTCAFTFILIMQFAYIASCPFIFQKHYLISPLLFSFIFSFNAAIFGVGAFLPAKVEINNKITKNICLALLLSCIALIFIPAINASAYLYEFILIIFRLLTGACFTIFMSKALDSCRENAGVGAAFLGTFYFLFGSIITPLVGYGNILYSSAMVMSVFAGLTYWISRKVFRLNEIQGNIE